MPSLQPTIGTNVPTRLPSIVPTTFPSVPTIVPTIVPTSEPTAPLLRRVISMDLSNLNLTGELNIKSLSAFENNKSSILYQWPQTLQSINLDGNQLYGTSFEVSALPPDIENVSIGGGNQFSGEFDFEMVANFTYLKSLDISDNFFSGNLSDYNNYIKQMNGFNSTRLEYLNISNNIDISVSVTNLPNMLYFDASGTTVHSVSTNSDFLELSKLPAMLRELYLSNSNLKGSIDLSTIAESNNVLEVLYLDANILDGTIDLRNLSQSLQIINLQNNDFTGLVCFCAAIDTIS